MYIYGGYDDFGLNCNDMFQYSFIKNEWTKVRTLGNPPDKFHHISVVYEGSMYLFGGQGEDKNLYDYRFDTNTWNSVKYYGKGPGVRWGHKAVVFKNKFYVIGGADNFSCYNDCFIFDFETSTWKSHKRNPKFSDDDLVFPRRYFHSFCVRTLTDELVVFGGKNVHNYTFNDSWFMPLCILIPLYFYFFYLISFFGSFRWERRAKSFCERFHKDNERQKLCRRDFHLQKRSQQTDFSP